MQKFLHTAPGGENTVVEQHINAVVRGGENQPVGLHRPDGEQRLADGLGGPRRLQRQIHVVPQVDHLLPFRHLRFRQGVFRKGLIHLVQDHVAPVVLAAVRHGLPDFVAS